MTKPAPNGQLKALRHSSFGFLSSLVIRHLAFLLLACSFTVTAGTTAGLSVAWTNNMLSISGPDIPGGKIDIWYLEAFCRSGSTRRDWRQTTIPHRTEFVSADKKGKRITLRTAVEPNIEVAHDIRAGK